MKCPEEGEKKRNICARLDRSARTISQKLLGLSIPACENHGYNSTSVLVRTATKGSLMDLAMSDINCLQYIGHKTSLTSPNCQSSAFVTEVGPRSASDTIGRTNAQRRIDSRRMIWIIDSKRDSSKYVCARICRICIIGELRGFWMLC